MRYRFIQDWREYKVGDRVPASVNRNYLLRAGIIERYSYAQKAQEASQEAQEATEVTEAQEATEVEEVEEVTEVEEVHSVTVDDVLNGGTAKKGKR